MTKTMIAKRRYALSLMLVALTVMSAAAQERKVLVLHTNDTHSQIFPLDVGNSNSEIASRAGFLRRIAMLKEERVKDPELLLFDSGDFCQGSEYYTYFHGDVEVGLMNMMHYDAATIGNHEFDFGLEKMADIFRKANFPIVCANYDFTGTPVEGIVKPFVIINRYGLRIGVFGLSPEMKGLVYDKNCQGVAFLNPVVVANETARRLKDDEHCDLVICLSHLGWDMPTKKYDDRRLVPAVRNVDVVLGGHSHTYFKNLENLKDLDGKTVPVNQNGKYGAFVGKIVINVKR